jgi:hypothetical protein
MVEELSAQPSAILAEKVPAVEVDVLRRCRTKVFERDKGWRSVIVSDALEELMVDSGGP